jgi:hypothetical protein
VYVKQDVWESKNTSSLALTRKIDSRKIKYKKKAKKPTVFSKKRTNTKQSFNNLAFFSKGFRAPCQKDARKSS